MWCATWYGARDTAAANWITCSQRYFFDNLVLGEVGNQIKEHAKKASMCTSI